MKEDAIMTELWRRRDEHAKRFDYDIKRICEHLKSRQQSSLKIVDLTSKAAERTASEE